MTDLSRKDQLIKLVMQIVPSQMKHHAEAEACDLLMEVERLDVLQQFVHEVSNFSLLEFFILFLRNIHRGDHDHEGGSPRAILGHCTQAELTSAIPQMWETRMHNFYCGGLRSRYPL